MPGINFDTIKNAFASFLGQSESKNAIDMLIEDHRRVKQIFEAYKDMQDDEKLQSVHNVLVELALHAAVEEHLIYPLLGDVGEREGMNESKEEHHVMKFLMSELEAMQEVDELLDAKFKVLSEIVDHHVQEEELEYFPKLRGKEEIDLQQLGEQLTQHKEELLQRLGDESDLGVIDPELRAHANANGGAYGDQGLRASADELSKKRAVKLKSSTKTAPASKSAKREASSKKAAAKTKPVAKKAVAKSTKKVATTTAKTKKAKLPPKAAKKSALGKAKPSKRAVAPKSTARKATVASKTKATSAKSKSSRGKKTRAA